MRKDKWGNEVCKHRRRKSECIDCVACPHGRLSRNCRECGGSVFCRHDKFRGKCPDCTPRGTFLGYRFGAKKRSIPFRLSFKKYLEISSMPCEYCGASLGRNGIDRKDNSVGYTSENSVPCCSKCNLMKRDYSISEFVDHAKRITEFQSKGKQNEWFRI